MLGNHLMCMYRYLCTDESYLIFWVSHGDNVDEERETPAATLRGFLYQTVSRGHYAKYYEHRCCRQKPTGERSFKVWCNVLTL
jgi:hypothetical protein